MTVHFIGAGPGAPDLLTIRGRDLIAKSDLCLYAGSLVPDEILGHCPPHARKINTAPLSLEEIIKEIKAGIKNEASIVRLHSGDLSVWSAMGEQLRRLRLEDIPTRLPRVFLVSLQQQLHLKQSLLCQEWLNLLY